MKIEGSITLLIKGNQFDFKELSDKMSVVSTRTLKKGQNSGSHKMTFNLWEYEVEFDQNNFNKILGDFLTQIKTNKNTIEKIKKNNECVLDMFLQSDEAQLGITISPQNLQYIAELGLELDISIFSNGLVYDQNGKQHNINELFEY